MSSVSLCFHVQERFVPAAPQGSLNPLDSTSSGLTKSFCMKFVISGGRRLATEREVKVRLLSTLHRQFGSATENENVAKYILSDVLPWVRIRVRHNS